MNESDTQDRDFETEAAEDGWQPLEQWKGAPEKWVDAKTFVERGEQFLPIVNAKNRKLTEKVENLTAKIADLESGSAEFRKFHEQAIAGAKRERDQAIKDLEAERQRAVSEGDGEAFARADRQLQELRSEPETPPQAPPDMQAWLTENSWYQTDPKLAAIADGLSDVVKRDHPHLKGRAFLDKLTEIVKAEVPHKFTNTRRETPGAEGNGNTPPPRKKERTYADLPQDAKTACDKFVRTIPGYSKEQYLADYQWSKP